ncbi:uncharacterized protein LOC134289533 [Aedes albopictus]|uniref:Secreted protein n=1 Tax=Aedes albopictus TaxID=7160 RepID=A0ABM1ZVR4_AEDAL
MTSAVLFFLCYGIDGLVKAPHFGRTSLIFSLSYTAASGLSFSFHATTMLASALARNALYGRPHSLSIAVLDSNGYDGVVFSMLWHRRARERSTLRSYQSQFFPFLTLRYTAASGLSFSLHATMILVSAALDGRPHSLSIAVLDSNGYDGVVFSLLWHRRARESSTLRSYQSHFFPPFLTLRYTAASRLSFFHATMIVASALVRNALYGRPHSLSIALLDSNGYDGVVFSLLWHRRARESSTLRSYQSQFFPPFLTLSYTATSGLPFPLYVTKPTKSRSLYERRRHIFSHGLWIFSFSDFSLHWTCIALHYYCT